MPRQPKDATPPVGNAPVVPVETVPVENAPVETAPAGGPAAKDRGTPAIDQPDKRLVEVADDWVEIVRGVADEADMAWVGPNRFDVRFRELPGSFWGDTSYLLNELHKRCPDLDGSAIPKLFDAVVCWRSDETLAGFPDARRLRRFLDNAMLALSQMTRPIQERWHPDPATMEATATTEKDPSTDSGRPANQPPKPPRKRRNRRAGKQSLTVKQAEAVHMVGECKGSLTEAGRRLGKDPSTVRQHYETAMRKMGGRVVKHATKPLPTDLREQVNISTDRRRLPNDEEDE